MSGRGAVAKRQIRKALRTLAQDMSVEEELDPQDIALLKTIPQDLHHLVPGDTVPGSPPSLAMSSRTYRLYRQALGLLLAERRKRYLSDRELEECLWSFCCEIALDDALRAPPSRKNKIEAFTNQILPPCREFEAIVQITGISIPRGTTLGEVEFIRGSPTLLKDWDLWSQEAWRPQWRGHTVARMRVTGGTLRAAQLRALERASMLCDELRIALPSSLYVHVDDIDLAFGTGWSAARGDGSRIYRPGRQAKKPARWNPDSLSRAWDYLAPLYDLRETARSDVRERAELAIRWFGMAWSVGTPWAMRVIALFSGLEAILVKGKGEPKKDAPLAIRAAMLSIAIDGHFQNPAEALDLYRERSELVHGSRTSADEEAFRRTFALASEALRNYLAFANRNAGTYGHKRLLDSLADGETLSGLKQWIEEYRPWGERELLSEIERLGTSGGRVRHETRLRP